MVNVLENAEKSGKREHGNGQPGPRPRRPEPLVSLAARERVRDAVQGKPAEAGKSAAEGIASANFDNRLAAGAQSARTALSGFAPVLVFVEALAESTEATDLELAKTALTLFAGKVKRAEDWYPGLRRELTPFMRTAQKVLVSLGELDLGKVRESVSCAVQRMDNSTFDTMLLEGTGGVGPVFSGFTDALPMLDMLVHSDQQDDWQIARRALKMFCDKASKAHRWWPLRPLVPNGAVDQMEHRLAVLGPES